MTEVRHDEKTCHFVLDFYRTFVPEPLRGRGLAEKVVKAALLFLLSEELIAVLG